MRINERIDFIRTHARHLSQEDKESLRRIFRNVSSSVQYHTEENEELCDALIHSSDLLIQIDDLTQLKKSLKSYLGEKGLSESSLKGTELLDMIKSDHRGKTSVYEESQARVMSIKKIIDIK